jgi:hypothetical protein
MLEHHSRGKCNTAKLLVQAAEELVGAGKPLCLVCLSYTTTIAANPLAG